MADYVLRVGSRSVQGIRQNNEDNLHVDLQHKFFLVADGMGGQEGGELASGMAVDIIPKSVMTGLAANKAAERALMDAFAEANQAIIRAGQDQPEGRRMGTTAVCALQNNGKVFISYLGDSRAYLVRNDKVQLLTIDHSVAQALVSCGALSAEEARSSPYNNVLHKFLGCASMVDNTDATPFEPEAGDRLLLASDGLTNHINEDDLRQGARQFTDPQEWADHLVEVALKRGTKDNVTCIVVIFDEESSSNTPQS